MVTKKLIINSILAIGIGSLSAFAHAELKIQNLTKHDSTCVINNRFCSTTVLRDAGVTHPGQTNTISNTQINLACLGHRDRCVADVYMTNNCTGPVIAQVIFNTNTGIVSVSQPKLGYKETHQKFFIQLSGGPDK